MSGRREFDDSCDFCRIARGLDVEAELVSEDDDWIAFFPLEPATPGHTLIIPRSHVPDLWHLPARLHRPLMSACVKIGQALNDVLEPEGMNLISSAGSAAEQTIFHLHLHVVPRWGADGFGRIWPTDSRYEATSLEGLAEKLRKACDTR